VVKRGEVWLVILDPTVGREIQKTRPCIVISPPEINDHLGTVLVAPMTTGSHPAPFRVPVKFQGKSGLVLLDQARAIDKASAWERSPIRRFPQRSRYCRPCSPPDGPRTRVRVDPAALTRATLPRPALSGGSFQPPS